MATPDTAPPLDLAIVGSVGIDTIATPLETRSDVLGGAATHACAAAALFGRVGMVGIVGADFPPADEARLRAFGIDLEGLQRAAGPTFRWSGVYADDFVNRRTLRTELGVFADFRPQLPPRYRRTRYLLLGNIGPELQLCVLDQAAEAAFIAADTMDLWIRTAAEPLREVIRRVTLLTLNDGEARLLTGHHNLRDCAESLLGMGPRYVVIKKGEHGALLFTKDRVVILPAYPVRRVIDPTGAGDTFAGAALGYLAARNATDFDALVRGLRYGSVVASFGVEDFGLEALARIGRAEIAARADELAAMIGIPAR